MFVPIIHLVAFRNAIPTNLGGRRGYILHNRRTTIGRDGCDILLAGRDISRIHLTAVLFDGGTPSDADDFCRIVDGGNQPGDKPSAYGVRVNGVKVGDTPHTLKHGDFIVLAERIELVYIRIRYVGADWDLLGVHDEKATQQ